MKPRILIDIKSRQFDCEDNSIQKRLNLSYKKGNYQDWFLDIVPVRQIVSGFFITIAFFYFIFNSVIAPTGNYPFSFDVSLAAQSNNNEERKKLEEQLSILEKQMAQYEDTIAQYRKQGKTLQSEIKQLEAKIAKLNLQIQALNLSIMRLDKEINVTEGQIFKTEENINFNKQNLAQLLEMLYKSEQRKLLEIFLANPRLSDFFTESANLLSTQESMHSLIEKITEDRNKLIDQKIALANQRADVASIKYYRDLEKANIAEMQARKNQLLKITKGQESLYQKLLTDTKKTAAEIRKQIFKLLGGGELQFDEAYKLAKMAEKATGVRAALILAVLDRESALGKNVGRCDYKTSMHPTRDIPVFLQIVEELGLRSNLESGVLKVSCANSDGAYGGAMGPAQFLPSVWNVYKTRIAEITGNNPPSPWRNADAFVATALYLKDAGAAGNVSEAKEREAAARYYAGGRWRNYLWTYGERVVSAARKFEEDIVILNS
jgi:membrane-bound lytic murein transglycosylase B